MNRFGNIGKAIEENEKRYGKGIDEAYKKYFGDLEPHDDAAAFYAGWEAAWDKAYDLMEEDSQPL